MTAPLTQVAERPKGVVDPAIAQKTFRLARYQPSALMAPWLDHYWLVEWDLRGKPPFVQRTLPYPCVNLVFHGCRQTAIFGVVSGAFDYTLQDQGKVLGLRFKPGGFRALLGRPLRSITDKTLPIGDVFEGYSDAIEHAVMSAASDDATIAAADAFFAPYLPAPDPKVERLQAILAIAQDDPLLTRVEQLAERAHTSIRTLQALFSDYVGVSPKWVIRRYRLHEAADRLANDEPVDLAELAQMLGYYDQAHFTRDFHKLVGKPPQRYRKQAPGG